MILGVMMAASNASPPSMRLASVPAVALSIETLCPVLPSNSGSSSITTARMAPAVSSRISAADAGAAPCASYRNETDHQPTQSCHGTFVPVPISMLPVLEQHGRG